MLAQMIETKEVAALLKQGSLFVQRRMNPTHPEYIPNVQIGRKRFVKIEDLQRWIDNKKKIRPRCQRQSSTSAEVQDLV